MLSKKWGFEVKNLRFPTTGALNVRGQLFSTSANRVGCYWFSLTHLRNSQDGNSIPSTTQGWPSLRPERMSHQFRRCLLPRAVIFAIARSIRSTTSSYSFDRSQSLQVILPLRHTPLRGPKAHARYVRGVWVRFRASISVSRRQQAESCF